MNSTARNARARAHQCSICATPCAMQRDSAAHANGCAQCPLPTPAWGEWDCGRVEPTSTDTIEVTPKALIRSTAVAGVGPSLKRRLVAYRRAGIQLLTGPARRARSAACSICPHARPTAHTGLYACGKCRVCGGGDEIRMLRPESTCADGRWPALSAP